MKTGESIIFYCTFCGQKIAIHHDASGFRVACPICKNNVTVPKSHTYSITGPACLKSDTALMEALAASAALTPPRGAAPPPPPTKEESPSKITRRIKFARKKEEPAADPGPSSISGDQVLKGSTTLLMETADEHDAIPPPIAPIKLLIPPRTDIPIASSVRPPPKNGGPHDFSMILAGCACLAVGIAGSLVRPELFLVFSAFFLVGIVVGLFCLAERRPLWGIGLLLTSIITFLLLSPGGILRGTRGEQAQTSEDAVKGPAAAPAPETTVAEAPEALPAPDASDRREALPPSLEIRDVAETPTRAPLWFSSPSTVEEPAVDQPAAAPAPPAPAAEQARAPAPEKASPPITVDVVQQDVRSPIVARETLREAIKADLPFSVYDDCSNRGGTQQFIPSGWMGRLTALQFDDCYVIEPHGGRTCIRMAFTATNGWGGIAWQESENNWGKTPGGYDITGAKELSFWARAGNKETFAVFKIGVIGSGKYADTAHVATKKIKLTTDWKEYSLPLKAQSLGRVMSGFVCVLEGTKSPQVVYLDDIEFR